jgi:hypothetical protein
MSMDDLSRPKTLRCARCGEKIKVGPVGRLPIYCSASCKSMTFAKRRLVKLKAAAKPESAGQTITESMHRQMTWRLLQDAGIVPADAPLPEPRQE